MAQTLKKVFDIAIIAAVVIIVAGFAWSAIAGDTSSADAVQGPANTLSQVLASAE